MTIQANKTIRILSVNGETFAHHPAKLKSFHHKMYSNDDFLKIISFTQEPRNYEVLVQFINENITHVKNAENIINFLLDAGFLEFQEHCQQTQVWQQNNWQEAFQFHLHTNNLPKLMYNTKTGEREDVATMESYVEISTPPPHYKTVVGETITLEKPLIDNKCKLANLFKHHQYRLLNQETLSRLLYYAFGQIGVRHMRVTGEHVRKTVPSGGARHPIEAYLIIKQIEHLPHGIYHYNVEKHALTLIKCLSVDVIDRTLRQDVLMDDNRPGFNISLAILYSCVYARSMFRYRESRSYRVMQYDLGHVTQNLNLIAKAYGLNFYSGYSCQENDLEKLFGIDSYMESFIAYSVL